MQVKEREFADYGNKVILSDTDSGLCLVQYTPVEKPELSERAPKKGYSYYGNDTCFEIYIRNPKPREVLRIAIVQRTSHNLYKASYADALGCANCTAKNYDEIHAFLKPLWQRSLQQ
ncbi:MAG: hypothetical protein NC132_03105 [Corallococcus sp.]|nr:hypothetical protein [Corallococcus sp.]MCM1359095.1 hypothetical protein [Corallococcus sp.]MCM1395084.1 hypothetical protein [Corallococcus sp.]